MTILARIHSCSLLPTLVRLTLILSFVGARATFGQSDSPRVSSIRRVTRSAPLVTKPALPPGVPWQAGAACPASVDRYAFAQDGENFYVISGVSGGPNTTNVWRYNAVTNIWTKRANIPAASQGPAGALLNGKIYVVTGDGTANAFYIYDIATDVWTTGPARPGVTDSYGAAAGAYNGKIYIVGGGAAGPTTTVSIYTIATNSWSVGPVAPSPVQLAGYTQVGQYLYVVGGFTATTTNSMASRRLDMASNTWSNGPGFTPQRGDFGLAAAGTKLIAIGGDTTGGDFFDPSAQVDELDTTTWPSGTWVASPDNLPTVRQGNSAGFVSNGRIGGEIWSTGGATVGFINEHLFRAAPICTTYTYSSSTASIVPGTVDTGNHTDDGSTVIMLPFPYRLYDSEFTNVAVGSNGHLTFGTVNNTFDPTCIPVTGATYAIGPYWTDQCTANCTGVVNPNLGIFTSVSGVAPNRIFNIEWRTAYFNSGGAGVLLNYEVRLYERQTSFDVIYGLVNSFSPPAARKLSTGVQKNNSPNQFTLEGCDSTGGTAPPVSTGQLYHYTLTNTSCPPLPAPTGFLYALNEQDGSSNQIYGFSVNETTGALTALSGFPVATGGAGAANGGGEELTVDAVNQRLYAINDTADTLSAYTIDSMTGGLTAMPFSPIVLSAGGWYTVATHPSGSPLIVGSAGAIVRSFTITSATAVQAAGSPYSTGSAPPASSTFSRDGNYYYAGGNVGTAFAGFSVNSGTGVLSALAGSPYPAVDGFPGAYATDSQGRLLMGTSDNGKLRAFTTASGVPTPVTGNPFASGLTSDFDGVLHPGEQLYFVTDYFGNQVGGYRVGGSGAATTLTPVTGSPFAPGGTAPKALVMNQAGSFLFVANSTTRNLTKYDVNPATGLLNNSVVQPADTLGAIGGVAGIAYTNTSIVRTAVSRKTHGAAGIFDINLPLTGTPGIECRNGSGPNSNDHQIVVSCVAPVTLTDVLIVSGTISGGSVGFSGNVITLTLNGVANAQRLILEFRGVTDGVNTGNFTLPVNFLVGDTNGTGAVNASDISQVKIQSGQAVTGTNFRTDVTANGSINASDVSVVKTKSGTALP